MKIKTKYEVGTHIWVVYEHRKTACVYDTHIVSIIYNVDGLVYMTEECNEIKEEEIILYEDEKTLVKRIKEISKIEQ